MKELYKKYRPKRLKRVFGQEIACKKLAAFIEDKDVPHTILFTGPAGTGKTTLARIVSHELGCGKSDFQELNTADFRGIDSVRDVRMRIGSAPISGDCRVWLMDECHKLTNDAQNAFLKMLEDTPEHVYFMLATTEPERLIKTLRSRATQINLKALSRTCIKDLLKYVMKKESLKIPKSVINKITEYCEGSARSALVSLHSCSKLEEEEDMLEALQPPITEKRAIEIARLLINPKARWGVLCKVLRDAKDEDPEGLRWMVLGYTKAVMSSGKNPVGCYKVIEAFRDNFYDSKWAGFIAACWEVISNNS